MAAAEESTAEDAWDFSSDPNFVQYYAEQSLSDATRARFAAIRDVVLRIREAEFPKANLDVGDVGCGAGSQSLMWAEGGHRVRGLDVNADLIQLGRSRAQEKNLNVEFSLGSATALPWGDESLDVVLLPELLEHVADWQSCLNEAVRVLRRDGILYLSTSNWLCPKQQEFTLPLYSWYPGPIKRRYEKLAVTTRPEIANYATYPAVNWFSFFGLKRYLAARGFECMDRFDLMDTTNKSLPVRVARDAIRTFRPLRLAAHVATPYTVLLGIKRA